MVRKLRKLSKLGQVDFEKRVKSRGFEVACQRTAEEFSQADISQWLREVYSAYSTDLERKTWSLQDLHYTNTSVSTVCNAWQSRPEEQLQGEKQFTSETHITLKKISPFMTQKHFSVSSIPLKNANIKNNTISTHAHTPITHTHTNYSCHGKCYVGGAAVPVSC